MSLLSDWEIPNGRGLISLLDWRLPWGRSCFPCFHGELPGDGSCVYLISVGSEAGPGSPLSHRELPGARAIVPNRTGNFQDQGPGLPPSGWNRFLCMASRSRTEGLSKQDHPVPRSLKVSTAKKPLVLRRLRGRALCPRLGQHKSLWRVTPSYKGGQGKAGLLQKRGRGGVGPGMGLL